MEGHHIRKDPEDFNREVIALGNENIWLCQMGREAEDGSFVEFVEAVSSAELAFDGQNVKYRAPGIGLVRFGWDGPLTVDGEVVSVEDYPRYDNPYVQAEFDPKEIHVKANGKELYLNWETGKRVLR